MRSYDEAGITRSDSDLGELDNKLKHRSVINPWDATSGPVGVGDSRTMPSSVSPEWTCKPCLA